MLPGGARICVGSELWSCLIKATDLPVLNCGTEHPYRHINRLSARTLNITFCSCSPAELAWGLFNSRDTRCKQPSQAQIYLCLHWELQLITKGWQYGNCIMKNIPSTFPGLLHITTLCGVTTQCSSLKKVEKPGYGSATPLDGQISIIFPNPLNA